jgi:hypothetical protein
MVRLATIGAPPTLGLATLALADAEADALMGAVAAVSLEVAGPAVSAFIGVQAAMPSDPTSASRGRRGWDISLS